MNKRIRKKKEKQRQEWLEHSISVLAELVEALEAAEREYWWKWAEESRRQFAEALFQHFEEQRRKEELTQ